jgi:transitional endoplasmic reticulum ATPase
MAAAAALLDAPIVTDIDDIERRLLTHPFDHELRCAYATALLERGAADAALAQFELVLQQAPARADAMVGAAQALLALGRRSDALTRYDLAKSQAGFVAKAELDALEAQARRTAPPQLRLAGAAAPNVVALMPNDPDMVRFSSIAGMEELKRTLRLKIIEPFVNPGLFERFKRRAGGGVLLYGPPGCGKTLIARALANECKAAFIAVGISDVLNMWIGESERNLAALFEKARAETPCVLFFDELDALAYSRSKARSEHTRTVVNEFLAQLDGVQRDNLGVLVLAATNMPWDVDPAMKRPGRFSRQIFVPPPDAEARLRMLEIKLTGVPHRDLELAGIAERTRNFSGADIDGLLELATESALEASLTTGHERPVLQSDFEHALQSMNPSTLDWLRTARNLVKYAGDDRTYRDVATYLKKNKLD